MSRLVPETDSGRALLLGLTLLAVGLYLAWPPAAFIVPGLIITLLAFLPTRSETES